MDHKIHIRCVEVSEVERFESGAAIEHPAHVRHILGVEVSEVKRFET